MLGSLDRNCLTRSFDALILSRKWNLTGLGFIETKVKSGVGIEFSEAVVKIHKEIQHLPWDAAVPYVVIACVEYQGFNIIRFYEPLEIVQAIGDPSSSETKVQDVVIGEVPCHAPPEAET